MFCSFATVLLLTLTPGLALQCYNCTTNSDTNKQPWCGEPFNETITEVMSSVIKCKGIDPACYKIEYKIGNRTVVDRNCYTYSVNDACDIMEGYMPIGVKNYKCFTCQENKCNNSSLHLPSIVLILISTILITRNLSKIT